MENILFNHRGLQLHNTKDLIYFTLKGFKDRYYVSQRSKTNKNKFAELNNRPQSNINV